MVKEIKAKYEQLNLDKSYTGVPTLVSKIKRVMSMGNLLE
jgi:hypothetical protein